MSSWGSFHNLLFNREGVFAYKMETPIKIVILLTLGDQGTFWDMRTMTCIISLSLAKVIH